MKLIFWKREREGPVEVIATRDTEVQRAHERALLAQREAIADLQETTERAKRSREERTRNHFGPLIYDAMKRPKK
jgi:hypothetical protein